MTNGERLQAVLDACCAHYDRECGGLQKNESSWGMYVAEPALDALGWPRQAYVKENGDSDGAHFEWPRYRAADAALLDNGRLLAFGEFKQDEYGCVSDITRHRDKYQKLQTCDLAFATWYGDGGGFGLYTLSDGKPPSPIGEGESTVRRLAHLAKPVLLKQQSPENWLDLTAESDRLPWPRLSIRAIHQRFFGTLFDRLDLPNDRPFRLRAIGAVEDRTPERTPYFTFVHRDLHPKLPEGWGITLSIDVIREKMICTFYERSTRALKNYGCTADLGPPANLVWIDDFIDRQVLAQVEARRQDALKKEAM